MHGQKNIKFSTVFTATKQWSLAGQNQINPIHNLSSHFFQDVF